MLVIFSSAPFYSAYVHAPSGEVISSKIRNNPKYWPYFKDAVGAIDGSHIVAAPPAAARSRYRNRKGFLSQNCLFACDFDLRFTFALTGWEGSASDARVYDDALSRGFRIPHGKYLLGDLGFPFRPTLLVPYHGVRYHLAEWGRAGVRYESSFKMFFGQLFPRPATKEELFNLRHASARCVIERIFGVLKRRFRILLLPLPFKMEAQARIPAALCVLYNFMCIHDSEVDPKPDDPPPDKNIDGTFDFMPGEAADNEGGIEARTLRDGIATAMWHDYSQVLHLRGQGHEYDEDDM